MEGSCSTGQSPQWAVVPVEEEEEEEEEEELIFLKKYNTVKQQNSNIFTAFSLIMLKSCMLICCSFSLYTKSKFVFDPLWILFLYDVSSM
jgi:hypothetical protein